MSMPVISRKKTEDQHTKMQHQFGYPSIVSRIPYCQTYGTYALTGLEMHLDIKRVKVSYMMVKQRKGGGMARDALE